MSERKGEQTPDLVRMRGRLDDFRRGSSPGKALPGWAWAAAGRLARRYGVHRTGRALGLEYNKLKRVSGGARQATAVATGSRRGRTTADAVKFVELTGALPCGGVCRLVLEGANGERVRVEMAPSAATQVVLELCRAGFGART